MPSQLANVLANEANGYWVPKQPYKYSLTRYFSERGKPLENWTYLIEKFCKRIYIFYEQRKVEKPILESLLKTMDGKRSSL